MIEHIEQSDPKIKSLHVCELCGFSSAVIRNYIRHTATAKHIGRLNTQHSDPTQKTSNFYCETCDVSCSYIRDYNRHLTTARHLRRMTIPNDPLQKTSDPKYQCNTCNKVYKSRYNDRLYDKHFLQANYHSQRITYLLYVNSLICRNNMVYYNTTMY
mgnify:CR=1 FL=1